LKEGLSLSALQDLIKIAAKAIVVFMS